MSFCLDYYKSWAPCFCPCPLTITVHFEHTIRGVLLNCQVHYITPLSTTFQWFPPQGRSQPSELPMRHSLSLSSDISALTLSPSSCCCSILAGLHSDLGQGQCAFLSGCQHLLLLPSSCKGSTCLRLPVSCPSFLFPSDANQEGLHCSLCFKFHVLPCPTLPRAPSTFTICITLITCLHSL